MVFAQQADHLLLTRVVTQGGPFTSPDAAESFSIYNPTNSAIDLSNYYVCDDEEYYKMQTVGDMSPSSSSKGFTAQFPDTSIPPGATFHIVLNEDYKEFYGEDFIADLVMFGSSDSSLTGSIGFSDNKIDESSELIILFKWDGESGHLIEDVDYFLWGQYHPPINKTGISTYQDDTPSENQLYYASLAEEYDAYSRIGTDEVDEIDTGGNGITGHDETSENFQQSWEIISLFNIGCTDPLADNFNPEAIIDDESCEYLTSIIDIINGSFALGHPITTQGTIVGYVSSAITGFKHLIIIEDQEHNSLTLTIASSDWDNNFSEYASCPYARYEIKATGTIDEYCSDCVDITTEIACEEKNKCMWDDANCIDKDCSIKYTSQIYCDADSKCIWDDDSQTCDKDYYECNESWRNASWECSSLGRNTENNEEDYHYSDWEVSTSMTSCSQLVVSSSSRITAIATHEVSPQLVSFQNINDEDYFHKSVMLEGVITDYFDVSQFCGPHSLTISNEATGNSLELSMWDDVWSDELECLATPPFFTKKVQLTGLVDEYKGNTQIQVCGDGDIEILNENYEWTMPSVTIPEILAGSYDSIPIITRGTIVDYFDITVYDGPHAITIEDENHNELELTIWPDYWDDTLAEYASCPYSRYEVEVTGIVNKYCEDTCDIIATETSCNDEDDDCMWDNGSCIEEDCEIKYPSQTDCEADEDCIWNQEDGMCKKDCTSEYNWECSSPGRNADIDVGDDEYDGKYYLAKSSMQECAWQLEVKGITGVELIKTNEISLQSVSFQEVLDGDYFHQSVMLEGVIADYFDITKFCGPHALTISDEDSGNSLELTMWNDKWSDELECLTMQPFFAKQIQVTGFVSEYEGDPQIQVCGDVEVVNDNYEWDIPSLTIPDILAGQYDGLPVITQGMIVDYFDVTVYDGPHALTIEDKEGYKLELSIWPDTYDIANSTQAYLLQPPYNRYLLSTMGTVTEYEGDKQLTISGTNSITVIDTINIDGSEYTGLMITFIIATNYDDFIDDEDEFDREGQFITDLADQLELEITKDRISIIDIRKGSVILDINIRENNVSNNDEHSNDDLLAIIPDITSVGEFEVEVQAIIQLSVNAATIKPEPYVIIPTLGEKLDFTYSYPENSRVIIRLFDLSGRFVTSLVDKYYTESATVFRNDDQSSWDGRDQLGQIVAPGTYIMHIEAMNPVTGETQTDAAPVVVGVKN